MHRICLLVFAIAVTLNAQEQNADIDSLVNQLNSTTNDSIKASIALKLAAKYLYVDTDSANTYNEIANKIAKQHNDTNRLIISETYFGYINNTNANYANARKHFTNVLNLAIEKKDSNTIAAAYGNIGNAYLNEKKEDLAISNLFKALQIFEKKNSTKGMATVYGVLGNIYLTLLKYDKALECYQKALELFHKIGWKPYEATSLMNIGLIYKNKNDNSKALDYFLKAQKIHEEVGNYYEIAQCSGNIGSIEFHQGNYNKAIYYHTKSFNAFEKIKAKRDAAISLISIGDAYDSLHNKLKTKYYYQKTLEYVDSLDLPAIKVDMARQISKISKQMGNVNDALHYYEIYTQWNDTLINRENRKNVEELLTKYETAQKEKEIELQKEKVKKRNIMLLSTFALAILLLGLIVNLVINYRRKKRDNEILEQKNQLISQQKEEILTQNEILQQQKEEIEAQRDEVIQQRDRIGYQNRLITDSIEYAKHIQTTILPTKEQFSEFFSEFFIYYQPRDIVSGDFYWIRQFNNQLVLAFADCTGHGVPGAFMSILGITLLNDIFASQNHLTSNQILEELRIKVKNSLKQSGKMVETKDGIEIAICKLNLQNGELEYAGANMPLIIVQKDQVQELIPTKNPIGYHPREIPFENKIIPVSKGDTLYLFTDGYVDQLGGSNYQKYKKHTLISLISEIHSLPIDEQEKVIIDTHLQWKGTNEQIDDILFMGLKI